MTDRAEQSLVADRQMLLRSGRIRSSFSVPADQMGQQTAKPKPVAVGLLATLRNNTLPAPCFRSAAT